MNIDISYVILSITILFGFFLFLRSVGLLKICALCLAVSSTWIVLLIAYYKSEIMIDPLILGVLMGGSVVGLMYLLEKKIPEKYMIFRLAFYSTLSSWVYFALKRAIVYRATLVLLVVWIISLAIFMSRRRKGVKVWFENIISCCKNW